jgi:hypothetical protein
MEGALLFVVLAGIPVVFWASVLWAVRHGPWPNRFWRGETVAGFAAAVTLATAAAGFFVGGMFLGQFGPPLGVAAALLPGIVVGVPWGVQRARGRAA